MIEQYLPNKNENAIMSKFKIFLSSKSVCSPSYLTIASTHGNDRENRPRSGLLLPPPFECMCMHVGRRRRCMRLSTVCGVRREREKFAAVNNAGSSPRSTPSGDEHEPNCPRPAVDGRPPHVPLVRGDFDSVQVGAGQKKQNGRVKSNRLT